MVGWDWSHNPQLCWRCLGALGCSGSRALGHPEGIWAGEDPELTSWFSSILVLLQTLVVFWGSGSTFSSSGAPALGEPTDTAMPGSGLGQESQGGVVGGGVCRGLIPEEKGAVGEAAASPVQQGKVLEMLSNRLQRNLTQT